MATAISNSDDVIDSRDVNARIEELEDERQGYVDAVESAEEKLEKAREKRDEFDKDALTEDADEAREAVQDAESDLAAAKDDLQNFDEGDEGDELEKLKAFKEEGEQVTSEWDDGAIFIRESHFEEYCQQECEDCGYISRDFPSWIVIDWEATANNMAADYSDVDFDGETFKVRSC